MSNQTPDPLLDGITHVNIYSQGKTLLGQVLSNFYNYPIVTKTDSAFSSVESYWYYLGLPEDCSQKEILRTLCGYEAKRKGQYLQKKYGTRIDPDFENKILRAIWYKVRRHERMFIKEIAKLPFEHYYVYGGKVVDVKDKYPWMMNGIDRMRNHILSKLEAKSETE